MRVSVQDTWMSFLYGLSIRTYLIPFSVITVILISCFLHAQELPAVEVKDEKAPSVETPQQKDTTHSVNIDTRVAYGNYNTVLAAFSIIQDHDLFTYQLNSDLRRSNDFGYKNSSYYEGEIGFTGKADLTESWKLLPEIQVKNESHGMYSNTFYNREEKDRLIFNLRNEYKPESSRWDFNVGTAHYVHRLNEIGTTDPDVITSSFYKLYEEVDWEYIWSGSNRFGFRHNLSGYNYSRSANADSDFHMDNEVFANFKVTEYVKVEGGIICDWDRSLESMGGFFPSGRINASLVGLRSASFEVEYAYDLLGFRPEDFYFEKKYIKPTYDLPPERVHSLDIKGEYVMNFTGEGDLRLKKIRIGGAGILEKNRDFYNYYPLPENVLSATTLDVTTVGGRAETHFENLIYKQKFDLDFFYEYRYYHAEKKVTYRPANTAGIRLTYSGERWGIEWENRFQDKLYIDPESHRTLHGAIIGYAGIQYRIIDSFYLYGRADNIYNSGYSLRDQYPEPGQIFMAGLRILF